MTCLSVTSCSPASEPEAGSNASLSKGMVSINSSSSSLTESKFICVKAACVEFVSATGASNLNGSFSTTDGSRRYGVFWNAVLNASPKCAMYLLCRSNSITLASSKMASRSCSLREAKRDNATASVKKMNLSKTYLLGPAISIPRPRRMEYADSALSANNLMPMISSRRIKPPSKSTGSVKSRIARNSSFSWKSVT